MEFREFSFVITRSVHGCVYMNYRMPISANVDDFWEIQPRADHIDEICFSRRCYEVWVVRWRKTSGQPHKDLSSFTRG